MFTPQPNPRLEASLPLAGAGAALLAILLTLAL